MKEDDGEDDGTWSSSSFERKKRKRERLKGLKFNKSRRNDNVRAGNVYSREVFVSYMHRTKEMHVCESCGRSWSTDGPRFCPKNPENVKKSWEMFLSGLNSCPNCVHGHFSGTYFTPGTSCDNMRIKRSRGNRFSCLKDEAENENFECARKICKKGSTTKFPEPSREFRNQAQGRKLQGYGATVSGASNFALNMRRRRTGQYDDVNANTSNLKYLLENETKCPAHDLYVSKQNKTCTGRSKRGKKKRKRQQSINVMLLNARSLQSSLKQKMLHDIVESDSIDVIAVTETHFSLHAEIVKFPKFHGWHKIRTINENRKQASGGVSIWVKNSLIAYDLSFEKESEEIENEQQWIGLMSRNEKFAFCITYWRTECDKQRGEINEAIAASITKRAQQIVAEGYKVILMGDFNAHVGNDKYGIPGNHPEINNNGMLVRQLVHANDAKLWNAEQTCRGLWTWERFMKESASLQTSVLDLVVTIGGETLIENMRVLPYEVRSIGSDHKIIQFRMKSENHEYNQSNQAEKNDDERASAKWNDLENINWEKFTETLLINLEPWESDIPQMTGEEMYKRILHMFQEVGEKIVGFRKPKRNSKSIYSFEVKQKFKHIEWLRVERNKLLSSQEELDNRRVLELNDEIRAGRETIKQIMIETRQKEKSKRCENVLIQRKTVNKKFYEAIKQLRYVPPVKAALKEETGARITNHEDIKREIEKHWKKTFDPGKWPEYDRRSIPDGLKIKEEDHHVLDSFIKEWEICKAIKMLKCNTSAGFTNIPPEFILKNKTIMTPLLGLLFQKWWDEENLPQETTKSKVTMLHKKGATDKLNNYRTIAVGCNISKTYLRIVTNRIEKVVEWNGILGEIQNGFRKKRRAQDNLLIVQSIIYKLKRLALSGYVAALDITKAYDRVPRDLLWKKMELMGFSRKIIKILKNLYKNPSGRVMFQGVQTKDLPMEVGLRQGCVLSPILFAIYIADLGRILEKSNRGFTLDNTRIPALFFADDMILMGSMKDVEWMLREIGEWSKKWRMMFAPEKSWVMPLKGKPTDKKWFLCDIKLEDNTQRRVELSQAEEIKYLGLILSRGVYIHIQQRQSVMNRMKGIIWNINNIAKQTDNPAKYGARIWEIYGKPAVLYSHEIMMCSPTYIRNLQIQQNKLGRMLLRVPNNTPQEFLQKELGWEPIEIAITKFQYNYLQYLLKLSEDRWVKKAYKEQYLWFVEHERNAGQTEVLDEDDEVECDSRLPFQSAMENWSCISNESLTPIMANYDHIGHVKKPTIKTKCWLHQVAQFAKGLNLTIHETVSKTKLKRLAGIATLSQIDNKIRENSVKRPYYQDRVAKCMDEDLHVPTQGLWLRIKMGMWPDPYHMHFYVCPLCKSGWGEKVQHVQWDCEETGKIGIREQLKSLIPNELKEQHFETWSEWMFNSNRTHGERENINSIMLQVDDLLHNERQCERRSTSEEQEKKRRDERRAPAKGPSTSKKP